MSRTAVITGGASGIGRASAQRLGQDGIRVVTLDVSGDADVVTDVTDPAAVGAAIEAIGPVDILVNSAGVVGPNKPLWEVSDQEWAATFAVNVNGTFHLCRAVVPGMRDRGWGRIVAITSLGVRQPYPNLALSNTARAGATGFLRTLAREVAPDGVTVNSVQPGLHATERVRQVYGDGDSAALAGALSTVPAGQLGEPRGLGALVAFLCSQPAAYLTGVAIPVDGGAYQALL